jgi:hypothetical protein
MKHELLRVLVADIQATEKKFDQIVRTLQDVTVAQEPSDSRSHTSHKSGNLSEPSMTLTVSTSQVDQLSNLPALVGAVLIVQTLRHRTEELHHQCKLVIKLVGEIGSSQYKLSRQIRHLMHQGVFDIHWKQWSFLRQKYGNQTVMHFPCAHTPVVRWLCLGIHSISACHLL